MELYNKKILITAGPTWVSIDSVRVISNIATGSTGILLAERLSGLGAKVTLLLGPAGDCLLQKKIKIIRFKFFDELRRSVRKELSLNRYDIIIHSAAVSDFKPKAGIKGKLKSGKSHNLDLTPLPKISDEIRRLAPLAKLVLFKLEYGIPDKELIKRARIALESSSADLAVANRIEPSYKAYVIDRNMIFHRAKSKEGMVEGLIGVIKEKSSLWN